MGKLNSLIKIGVFNVNALLFLGGIGMIIVASLVLMADFIKLAETYMKTRGIFTVAIGVLVAGMSVIGCVGTHRQIQRDRLWSGRRILSLYQLILVAVVMGQGIVQIRLYRIEVSLKEAAAELPDEHGPFESRFRDGFNEAYYDQLCSASGGESWMWSLQESLCSGAFPRGACSCTDVLDGNQPPLRCSVSETYTARECCPDKDFCEDGLEEACPYAACRPGILDSLLKYITPARKYSTFVFVLEGLVLILTCLLICYNPRDSTEDILIKTGSLVRNHDQLEAEGERRDEGGAGGGGGREGLKYVDVGGASGDRHPASATDGAFELDLLQPAAVAAARRAEAGLREGAGGYKPRGSAPPGLSPLAASNAPVDPLSQFMTPRFITGEEVMFAPGSPTGGDDESFEYHNLLIGTPPHTAKPPGPAAAAATAAAAAAAAAGGSEAFRNARGAMEAASVGPATGTVVSATALAGLVSVDALTRRRGEEKTGEGDDDGEEEKKETVSPGRPLEHNNHHFYGDMGAQTPIAEYGKHHFETGEGPLVPSQPSGVDPDTILTDGSSVLDGATSKGVLHAGGSDCHESMPSLVTPPLPGDNGTDISGETPGVGELTPVPTTPTAAGNRPRLGVSILATNATDAAVSGQEEGGEMASSGVPPGPSRFSAQTPIASPPGGASPRTFMEQTSELPPTLGVGTEEKEQTAALPPTPIEGGAEDNSGGILADSDSESVLPCAGAAADEPASAQEGGSPQSNVTQAAPSGLSIPVENDAQHQKENIGELSGDSPGTKQRVRFRGRISAQTPIEEDEARFNSTPASPAQEQQQQQERPVVGSASYPGNITGCSSSFVVAAEVFGLGPPSEEPSVLPESVEPAPTPQPVVSTAEGHSRNFLVQTPLSSPPMTKELYESAVSTDTQPTALAAQEVAARADDLFPASVLSQETTSQFPQPAEQTPKAERVLTVVEGGSPPVMAQTPLPRGDPALYESAASTDTQPTASAAQEVAARAGDLTPASVLSQETASRLPQPAEQTPKAERVLTVVEGGSPPLMAQTPLPQRDPALYEPAASTDTQPTASAAQEAAARAGDLTPASVLSQETTSQLPQPAEQTPKAERVLTVVEGGSPPLMAQTPLPRGNPELYESAASTDTQPTASTAQEAEGRGGGGGGAPASTDAAASTGPTDPEPQSKFARFLLKAQDSMSKAQMALSLEFGPPSSPPETYPAHVSPLRPEISPPNVSPLRPGSFAAETPAAAEPSLDASADKTGKTTEETAVEGEPVVGGGGTSQIGG